MKTSKSLLSFIDFDLFLFDLFILVIGLYFLAGALFLNITAQGVAFYCIIAAFFTILYFILTYVMLKDAKDDQKRYNVNTSNNSLFNKADYTVV